MGKYHPICDVGIVVLLCATDIMRDTAPPLYLGFQLNFVTAQLDVVLRPQRKGECAPILLWTASSFGVYPRK